MTSEEWHHETIVHLYDLSKKRGHVRGITDFNRRNSCGRESASRYSPSYIRRTSVILWDSLFAAYLMDNRFTPYTWMIELKITPTILVGQMHEMREYGLFPIGLLKGCTLAEDFNASKLDFTLVFSSEEDMVAGGALL